MDSDRENPSPLARLPGGADTNWHDWSPELETAYLQHIAGVDRLEDATSLQLVVNTSAGGSVAHLGATLPNLLELNLSGSTLDSLRDLGTGFRLLQVLWVSRCGLKALDGLNGLPSLRELYAAYNDIADLQPVDCCTHLEILDVECNCISDTDAVLYLTACSHLQSLTLAGNPAALKPEYRQTVIAALPSLHSLDDEPVTPADRNPQQQQHGRGGGGAGGAGGSGGDGSGSRSSGGGRLGGGAADVLAPSPLRAAAAAAFSPRQSLDAWASASPSGAGGTRAGSSGGPATAAAAPPPPPDADEVAFVVAGIKHARVGVDSHEFREIEMNLLVATADGTEVQLDVRPGTSTLLPASASTWVRTLRSSREGSLAALRASAAAAAASAASSSAAAGRTGSQSPTSPCSASPISSRPPSSQQQQQHAGGGPAGAAPVERWAIPAGPGAAVGMFNSFGAQGTASSAAGGGGTRRPSSGTGILSGGGAGAGGMTGTVDSPMRPGSGGYRLGTGRPYSARPGTAASFSARLGTSASTGAAPASASAGLYWAKNRISGGSAAGGGPGSGADGGAAADGGAGADADVASSKLTLGSDTTFGGSFARDLRKWKGAAVRAAAAAAAASGGDVGAAAAAAAAAAVAPSLGGSNGISSTLRRDGQLDPKALLEELKRWKLETADRVLFVDPDESATGDGWVDGLDRGAGSSGGGGGADILRLTSSQDGAAPELAAAIGLSLQLLEQPAAGLEAGAGAGAAGAGAAYSPVPGSPLQPPRPPPGAIAAGRRKMVLAKVLRDIAADSISSSGVCISEILAGLRPVHAPPAYGSSGPYTPGVAWGPPGSADSSSSRDRQRDKPGGSASAATTPTSGYHPHSHHQQHHHNQHQHHHGHSKSPHGPHSQQQQQKYQQQQQNQQQGGGAGGGGANPRGGSGRSVCSSSGQSDCGPAGAGGATQSSRPGSREEQPPVSGGNSSGGGGVGPQLQRQKSASRAPGLPPGPSAPAAAAAAAYRVGWAAS